FLLILAFSSGFDRSDPFTKTVYLVALLSTAGATALIIAPVAVHRMLFRLGEKPQVVIYAHRMAYVGLMLVILAMVSAVMLASDAVIDRWAAVMIGVVTGLVFALLW